MSNSVQPIDGSPPGFPVPGIFQARTLEWGAIAFSFLLLSIMYFSFFHVFSWFERSFILTLIFHQLNIPWFIHSSNNRRLDCFQVLVIMNDTLKIFVCKVLCGHVFNFFGQIPRKEIFGSNGKCYV